MNFNFKDLLFLFLIVNSFYLILMVLVIIILTLLKVEPTITDRILAVIVVLEILTIIRCVYLLYKNNNDGKGE